MGPRRDEYDAVIVGGGPNGLAAAITLAEKFPSVLLLEARDTIGGGVRSAQLTLPGFIHDVCSAVHPLAVASPFFRKLDLQRHGVRWIQPEVPLAHPFADGTALFLHRSLEVTAEALGEDGKAYLDLFAPLVENHQSILEDALKPLPVPDHPFLMARFALNALRSAKDLAYAKFQDARTRALFAGLAGHAMIPLERRATAAFGIVLAMLAHSVGWPVVEGGSQDLADVLARCFSEKGGAIETGKTVSSAKDLPRAQYYFFDVTPRQILNMEGLDLSAT
ncbi:MAG TPA: NAD(P)/FAD-dependent oxidoreductase, partial [Thermodesulfobacteriota bacterium]|nr:NAD(P)/FAD-dependent oxidoreductase [Thermodesulfobacteriota bacterium]